MLLLILTTILATFIAVAVFLYLAATQSKRAAKSTTLPRGYKGTFAACPPDRKMPAARDAFKARKVPEDLDYVIIGSGIGGMYTAALLAKVGKKVLVLEQHYIAGGCMHCFDDKGFEFDTGVHYVGKVEKYGMLLNMVTEEGVAPVEWAQMGTEADGFVYDEIHVGTEPFKLPARSCTPRCAATSRAVATATAPHAVACSRFASRCARWATRAAALRTRTRRAACIATLRYPLPPRSSPPRVSSVRSPR